MKVLSLFDGMACGLQALKEAGIHVSEYHSFENDKYAIAIAMKNHPEIIQHGEINFMTDFSQFKGVDLIIGGSPCQGFSMAGKQLNFNDPRSQLFFEFVRAIREAKPKWFLLENVRMKEQYITEISRLMGVEPKLINSAAVSAQDRLRNYWCNWSMPPLEDQGLTAQAILQNDVLEPASAGWHKWFAVKKEFQLKKKYSKILTANCKAITLVARMYASWNGNLVAVGEDSYRWLTPIECERLQTLPDNYTAGVSDSQRYKMLGNGWTVKVISHIFKNIPKR